MNPKTPAEIYRLVDERGPDERFAKDRAAAAKRIAERLHEGKARRTAEKALTDWRKLAARRAAR